MKKIEVKMGSVQQNCFNKKILIIGGSGYIGSFLRKKLPYDLSSVNIS